MRCVVLIFALTLCGCAGLIGNDSKVATQNAVNEATSPDAIKKWDALAAGAAGAARDKFLDDETKARIQVLIQALGESLKQELAGADSQILADLHKEVEALRLELGPLTRQIVRQAIDEAFSDKTTTETKALADALREELVGAPLRKDLEDARLQVTTDLAPLQAQAVADAVKIEHYAEIGGAAFAILCIIIAIILRDNHHHRQRIAALEARLNKS